MGLQARKRVKVITSNTTITDRDFCDWSAVNIGTAPVEVDKVELQPREGLPFMSISPEARWESPISINFPTPGGKVVLMQLIYKDDADKSTPSILRDIWGRIKK